MKFFLIYIFFYFLNIGFLTILERKILGLLQNRRSLCRVGVFNFYHFFLDFFKAVSKGIFDLDMGKLQLIYLSIFLFYIFILLGLIFFLPLNFYSIKCYYGAFLYLMVDGSFMFLKIFLFNFFNFKFSNFSLLKIKKIYIIGESFFLLLVFTILVFFSFFGACFIKDFLFNLNIIIFFFIFFFFFFILLLKYFRTPFDYLEIETEFVGGLILEFYGVVFTLWMLFEYIFIFNGIFYLLFLFYFLFNFNFLFFVGFGIFLIILVFMSKGVLIRNKYFSTFFISWKIFYYFYFFILFIFIFS